MSAKQQRAVAAYDSDEEWRRGGLIHALTTLALRPVRPFVSRPASRAYLATFLAVFTALTLLGAAVIAYVIFYYSYIPRIGFERTIHLQFDNVFAPSDPRHAATITRDAHPYPYGSVSLAPDMVSAQAYDVKIELSMPRTPENMDAGNFMLEANMYAAGAGVGSPAASTDSSALLATSRRSTILPYRSPLIDLLYKATELHWYLLGFRSEAVKLTVPIYESVAFAKGRGNVPATMRLEIQSTHRLQIYSAKAHFRARFQGLRWLMYNYRILSAISIIGIFWTTEIVFAGLAYGALAVQFQKRQKTKVKDEDSSVDSDSATQIKREPGDDELTPPPALSDTERTYPTLSTQRPLRYASPSESSGGIAIKREEEDDAVPLPEALAKAGEADDEDEDEDVDFVDSGMGTSLESSGPGRSDSMRRRRGRLSNGSRNGI